MTELVRFLQSYPDWVQWLAAIWLLYSAGMVVLLLFVSRSSVKAS